MGKRWTTRNQESWLDKRLPDYIKAKLAGTKADYLLLAHEDWYKDFPERKALFPSKSDEETLSSDEEILLAESLNARNAQIDGWFDWRARKIKRDRTTQVTADSISLLRGLIEKEAAKNADRAPQLNEVYLRLYSEKVKSVYDSQDHSDTVNPGVRVNRLKAIAQRLLDEDTEEVRKEVEEVVTKWKKEKAESVRNLEAGNSSKPLPTPEEYQSALNRLPVFLKQIMDPLVNATGWTFTVLCGGPVPNKDSAPMTSHYHFGLKTRAGNDFSQSYPDFGRLVMHPFSTHVMKVFPEDLQSQEERALTHDAERMDTPPVSDARDANEESGPSNRTGTGDPVDGIQDLEHSTTPSTTIPSTRESLPLNTPTVSDSEGEDEDLRSGIGAFSFSDNRPIHNSTIVSEKGADRTAFDAIHARESEHGKPAGPFSSVPFDLTLKSVSPYDSALHLEDVMGLGSSIQEPLIIPSSPLPSETVHPGGPTEPLSRAMLRDSVQYDDQLQISTGRGLVESGVHPTVDLEPLERNNGTPPSQSLFLDSSVRNFIYNPDSLENTSADYIVEGARLNPPNITTHDKGVNSFATQGSETQMDPGPSSSIKRNKRARVPSNADKIPTSSERISTRMRKNAKFGPTIVSDPTAPKKKVKHSWIYAADSE